jgi:hypothetical protein
MSGLAQQAEAQVAARPWISLWDEGADDLMTEDELAAALKVKAKTLANQRSRRVGPPYHKLSGGIVRYSRRAVLLWLEDNSISHGSAA